MNNETKSKLLVMSDTYLIFTSTQYGLNKEKTLIKLQVFREEYIPEENYAGAPSANIQIPDPQKLMDWLFYDCKINPSEPKPEEKNNNAN